MSIFSREKLFYLPFFIKFRPIMLSKTGSMYSPIFSINRTVPFLTQTSISDK